MAHHLPQGQQPFDYEHNTLPPGGPSNSRNHIHERSPPLPSFRDRVESLQEKAFHRLGELAAEVQMISTRQQEMWQQ